MSLEVYERLTAKIIRANHHIRDLEKACQSFIHDTVKPYEIVPELDLETGDKLYRVVSVRDVPDNPIKTILGDVLVNLRGALDHTAHAFFERCPTPLKSRDVYFPMFKGATEYQAAKSSGEIQNLWQGGVDALDTIQPYKGGNNILWKLFKLNNRDKHRLLIAVGGVSSGRTKTDSEMKESEERWARERPNEIFIPADISHIVPTDNPTRILKAGDILHRVSGPEVNHYPKFLVQIALSETGIAEGEPLLPLIYAMKMTVNHSVRILSDYL